MEDTLVVGAASGGSIGCSAYNPTATFDDALMTDTLEDDDDDTDEADDEQIVLVSGISCAGSAAHWETTSLNLFDEP